MAALLVFVVLLLVACLVRSRMAGFYVRPPLFLTFRALFYAEQGLLAGAVLAGVGYVLSRLRAPRVVRLPCYAAFFSGFAWFCLWGLVRSLFAFELTPGYVTALFGGSAATRSAGLSAPMLVLLACAIAGSIAGFCALAVHAFERADTRSRRRALVVLVAAFLAAHLPGRAYFTYHINHDQFAVLALEDGMLFCLHSERLVPGLREARRTLTVTPDAARTDRYLRAISSPSGAAIPRKYDILYVIVDSLRFDAVSAEMMPMLWSRRGGFQLRLDREHWSGGNTTKWGIFSLLAGVAPCHLQDFFRAGVRYPLLTLLEANGYRLRVGKSTSLRYSQMEPFLPPSTILADVPDEASNHLSDERMVSRFLEDRQRQARRAPAFDLLLFDATHWPYSYPPGRTVSTPAPPMRGSVYFARSPEDMARAYNGYRNACRFVDVQIARLLDGLRADGRLDRTLVIVTGDHGQEFQEMGQFTHSAVINDYQARVPLWIRIPPGAVPAGAVSTRRSVHMDVVPTLLQLLGFDEDVLHTQGRSLFEPAGDRAALFLSEQGYYMPFYHALVTDTYVSRWRRAGDGRLRFSGVLRRDGRPIQPGDERWWEEARRVAPQADLTYGALPDATRRPRPFGSSATR